MPAGRGGAVRKAAARVSTPRIAARKHWPALPAYMLVTRRGSPVRQGAGRGPRTRLQLTSRGEAIHSVAAVWRGRAAKQRRAAAASAAERRERPAAAGAAAAEAAAARPGAAGRGAAASPCQRARALGRGRLHLHLLASKIVHCACRENVLRARVLGKCDKAAGRGKDGPVGGRRVKGAGWQGAATGATSP